MTRLRRRARWALAVPLALALLPAAAGAAPLTVTTSPVDSTLLSDTYALIGGTVNPGGTATSYQFEWGPTTAYGQSTPLTSAGNGTADVPVDFSLDALEPRTTYHFRLVAQPTSGDAAQRVVGGDQSFRTAPALALSLLGHTTRLVGKKAQLRLKAVGPADEVAQGVATIKAVIGKHKQTIAILPYSVATGTTKQVAVTVPASVRAVLKAAGHPKVRLQVRAKTSGIKPALVKTLEVVG